MQVNIPQKNVLAVPPSGTQEESESYGLRRNCNGKYGSRNERAAGRRPDYKNCTA